MPFFKIVALFVWTAGCLGLGVWGMFKLNDVSIRPVLAPLVTVLIGSWYAVVAATTAAPWIWLSWP